MVAREIAEAMGCFIKIAFLDDNSKHAIGALADYKRYFPEYSDAFVAIGNPELRIKWIRKLEEASYSVAVLVHPQAYVSPSAQVQKGCIIEPNAAVHTGASLADGVIVSAGAVINHNSFTGDVCHIDCGAVVAARAVVPSGTKVESLCVYQ
jgi:UDP-3-O-[3-hydroxymyristoyl] glucosamine N-acyltransferase